MSANAGWTTDMDARLRDLVADSTLTHSDRALAMNRAFGTFLTDRAVEARTRRLGIAQRECQSWTPAVTDRLRELIEGGMRASLDLRAAMKAEFGLDVTKGALIGRINRMGIRLTGRATGPRKPKDPKSDTPIPPPAQPAPPPPPAAAAEDRTSALIVQLVPVRSLQQRPPTYRTCQYPLGDPRRPDFRFCAADAEHGPYCLEHAERCYRGGSALDRDKIRKLASVR